MATILLILNLIGMTIHQLPQLPYALNALEPQISEETMRYHYGKHHQTYITNLNTLIQGTKFEDATLEEIIAQAEGPIFNNAAQAYNHTFFFLTLSPHPKTAPTGALLEAINSAFGSFDKFKEQFSKAAVGLFGSGWAWLVENKSGELSIVSSPNAGNPLTQGLKPLMCADVWEHAYYIDYRNRRADALAALWDRIDWNVVEQRYEQIKR